MSNKVDELKEIRRIVAEYDSQINRVEQDIQIKQDSLGDEVLAGTQLPKVQSEIRTMARNLSDMKQVRDVAGRQLQSLEKAVLEEEKQAVLVNQIKPLEEKYEAGMVRLIQALEIVWETDFTIQDCYQQAYFLASKYEIATSIGLRTIVLNGSDLYNRADVILKKIEMKMPEIYKASKAKTALERATIKRKIKFPLTNPNLFSLYGGNQMVGGPRP
jgi:hypothetical protein